MAPRVRAQKWFFDTELLLLAEQDGLRIHEVAVDYLDDLDSRVNVRSTATEDLRGVVRLTAERVRRRPAHGSGGGLARYVAVGVAAIALHLGLFAVLEPSQGVLAANALSLIAAAVAGTVVTRAVVFGTRDRIRWLRDGSQARVGTVALLLATTVVVGVIALLSSSPAGPALVAIALLDALALAARSALVWAWVLQAVPPPSVLDLAAPTERID